MTRRAPTTLRVAARALRRLSLLAACVAATALVALPGLHAGHAPAIAHASAVADAPLPAIAAHAHADAKGCALCAAVGHARTAIAAPAAALPVSPAVAANTIVSRPAARPTLAAATPFAPRAPPARS